MKHDIYVIGSLRNPKVIDVASELRGYGWSVFDDWAAAHNEADDHWRDYHKRRGHTFVEALAAPFAVAGFGMDKANLDASRAAVLVAPAGKSAHLELGYMVGRGKPAFVYFPDGEPEPDRWDLMLKFATRICTSAEELAAALRQAISAGGYCGDCPSPDLCDRYRGCPARSTR